MDSRHHPRHERLDLFLRIVGILAAIATPIIVALIATDTIVVQGNSSAKSKTTPKSGPQRGPQSESSRPRQQLPLAVKADGPCNREPNEDRMSALLISLETCEAALETDNDNDWFRFESPRGGQFQLVFEKEKTSQANGSIIVTVWADQQQIESPEHLTAEKPLVIPYTLKAGSELAMELIDGCAPGGCGLGGYSIAVKSL